MADEFVGIEVIGEPGVDENGDQSEEAQGDVDREPGSDSTCLLD